MLLTLFFLETLFPPFDMAFPTQFWELFNFYQMIPWAATDKARYISPCALKDGSCDFPRIFTENLVHLEAPSIANKLNESVF